MEFQEFNLIFIAIILLPNLLMIFYPPIDKVDIELTKKEKILEYFERVGQLGIFVSPLFFVLSFRLYLMIGLIISTLIYYLGWIRYLVKKRKFYYLFSPLMFIPIPQAIFPIFYFIILSFLLNSYILFGFTIIFSIGHIAISYKSYKRMDNKV